MPDDTPPPPQSPPENGKLGTFVILLLVLAIAVSAWYVPTGNNFLALLVLLTTFMLAVGSFVAGRPLGILVNERNLVSLSRLQLTAWTVVVLSGYIAIVCHRMRSGIENALAVPIDQQLWILMGISTSSLVGSGLVLDTKKATKVSEEVVTRAANTSKEKNLSTTRQGSLYANSEAKDASFKDIFQGDEVGNTCVVDLAKVQMFFFTLVFAGSYAADLYWKLSGEVIVEQFPPLSNGVVALLGISHAGYVASKSINHTPEPHQ